MSGTLSWSRATGEEYRRLPLRAHALLADSPVHDVWKVTLPGGGPGRTMLDVRRCAERMRETSQLGPVVRGLFGLRRWVGRLLRWDDPRTGLERSPTRTSLSEADLAASLVRTGTRDGPFTVLYVFESEALSEVRNATVHAFLVWALLPVAAGYELLWAIHVRPVGRWTRLYLAAIEPFRRWIVYPALLRAFRDAWGRELGAEPPAAGAGHGPG